MKNKRINVKNLIVLLTITIGILITGLSIFIIISKPHNIYNYTKESKNYSINIKYKKANTEELNEKIKVLLEKEKENFIKEATENKINPNIKYDLYINGNNKKYNNLEFVNITINKFNGGNHYHKNYVSYAYDKSEKKFITIEDIIKDELSFEQISLISKHLLNKYVEENKIKLDETILEKGTTTKEENYRNFYLSKEGLTVTFIPYQISSWSDGEMKITIPWNKLNGLLKEKYQNKKLTQETVTRNKRDISKYKNKKVIAFTFDDGPNTTTTKKLLNSLDKYDAKVTFFVLGSRVEANKEVLKRAYEEGNDIGSHTYSHKDLTTLKAKELEKEINKTNEKVKQIIGVEPIYLRPPYGSINNHVKNKYIMHTICWNIDSLDWKNKNRNKIKKMIVSNARDGAIVLLHDIYEESVNGALLAMKELQKKGYNFVTITEMAELKNITLGYDKTYYGF